VLVKQEFPNVTTSEAATECSARYKALTKNQKEKYEKLAADDRTRYKKGLGGASPVRADKKIHAKASSNGKHDCPEASSDEDEGEGDEEEHKETEKAIESWSPPAELTPPKIKYTEMVDPRSYYAEETAWRYHNPPLPPSREAVKKEDQLQETQFPYVSHEELRPVPPPPPPPTNFPDTPFCRWSYDEDTRVLLADFRRPERDVVVTLEDEKYLLESFERDDITVGK
jgi:HMG (high mobility group) box